MLGCEWALLLCGMFLWSSYSCSGCMNISDVSNGKSCRSTLPFQVEACQPSQLGLELHVINPRQRLRRCTCCQAATSSGSSWIQPRKLDNLWFFYKQSQKIKQVAPSRAHADFKSEEYGITGALESFVSPDGEAVLTDGAEQAKPWWEQFPKRWVIVLLCFAAFLLCNMDRVSVYLWFWLWVWFSSTLVLIFPFWYDFLMKLSQLPFDLYLKWWQFFYYYVPLK